MFLLSGGRTTYKRRAYACKKQDINEMSIVNLKSCANFQDRNKNLTWSKIMRDARNDLKVALIRKHSYDNYGIAYECSKAYINKCKQMYLIFFNFELKWH